MNTALSLPSETVAKAHINGLRRPQGVDLRLAAEEVTGLEKFPVERALKILQSALQDGGIAGQLAQNIQQARMQAASRMREVSEAAHRIPFLVSRIAQDIRQSRVQAASRMSHLAETANRVPFWGSNVARDMQQIRIQVASGINQLATSTHLAQIRMNQMTQMVQEAQKRVATEMNQFVTSAHVAQIRTSQITQALASRMSELTEAVHRVPFWASSIVQDIQQARMQVAPAISQFADSAHMAQMRMSQIERIIQRIVLHHPELATAAPGGGGQQSVNDTSSVLGIDYDWQLIREICIIACSMLSVDTRTWIWIRDNIIIPFLVAYAATTLHDCLSGQKIIYRYREHSTKSTNVEVRSKEDSQLIMADSVTAMQSNDSTKVSRGRNQDTRTPLNEK